MKETNRIEKRNRQFNNNSWGLPDPFSIIDKIHKNQ